MVLSSGTQYGSYEIAGEIGAGGMGVVYRATDTKLKRDVAIKVLPESLATDAERLTRFQREAEVLASLNHPNIAQIYGIEESDGTTALILELVEGPTLADRIAHGALAADEALGIAMQIADALEAAHSQGIVHRDLKPANIKLRDDGTVKVLDFGIAKALDVRATSGLSPVMATPTATETGIILGTAAYMSPEQARGKGVDERTDIWAFGCVLYEMLTGQQAFGGEDVTVMLARILEREPDMDALPKSVSPAIRRTIELCHKKDVRKRVADIRDVKLSVEGEFVPKVAAGAAARRPVLPQVASASLVVGLVVAAVAWSLWPRLEPPAVTRFAYDLPDGQSITGLIGTNVVISSDGRQFAYNTDDGVYVRPLDSLEVNWIPLPENTFGADAFSPDGQSMVGWGLPGQLKRMATIGGAVVRLADITVDAELHGVDWLTDGTILYTQRDGIYRVAADGGMPERLIPLEGVRAQGTELLPDGDSVLFSVTDTGEWDSAQIVVGSLSTGQRTELGLSGSDAKYLPTWGSTGHIVYTLGSQLFAVPFDPQSLRTSGAVVSVLPEVLREPSGLSGAAQYDVSDNGTLIYLSGDVRPRILRTLEWVDRQGTPESIDARPHNYRTPRISPDGTKIALTVRENGSEGGIWIWDRARKILIPVPVGPGLSRYPVWSSGSEQLAHVWRPVTGGVTTWLYRRSVDGSGDRTLLAETPERIYPTSFLPDGTSLLLSGFVNGPSNQDIATVPLDGSEPPNALWETPFSNEQHPEVSPDGRWLAYDSDESGNEEVWVRPYPNVQGGRHPISVRGGSRPLWSPDGMELFYRNDDTVMAVAINTSSDFTAGDPVPLFGGYPIIGQGGRDYDTRDGENFVMIKQLEGASADASIIVVENWFEELRRLAPAE